MNVNGMLTVALLGVVGVALTGCASKRSTSMEGTPPEFHRVVGEWERGDGSQGYVLIIKGISPAGAATVGYLNTRWDEWVKVSQAKAKLEKETITLFLELHEGYYPESCYSLTLSPDHDDLMSGTYFSARERQTFPAVFRKR